mgnify:CR=1 FL=1
MFSKSIIGAARFLRMPATARLLYYDLGMQADDDGVVEAFSVMRLTGATEDDLRVLVTKGFVRVLNDDLVTLISDWSKNNLIKKDRYRQSIYKDLIIQLDTNCQRGTQLEPTWNPSGTQLEPQDRLGKDSRGKENIGEENKGEFEGEKPADKPPAPLRQSVPYEQVKTLYNDICTSLPKCRVLSDARKKAIKARFNSGYGLDDFKTLFEKTQSSSFLTGRNDRNWMASFDWLLKDNNMVKTLDGNYDDHAGGPSRGPGGGRGTRQAEAWDDLPDGFLG